MANYRFTFEVLADNTISAKDLVSIYTDTESYIRNVLIPKGSTIQTRSNATVTGRAELNTEIHQHDGTDRCRACMSLAQDERN